MDIWAYLRLANVVMALVISAMMFVVNHRRVKANTILSEDLLFRQGLVVYLLAAAYATIFLIRVSGTGSPHLIGLTVGSIWMLVGIIRIDKRERKA